MHASPTAVTEYRADDERPAGTHAPRTVGVLSRLSLARFVFAAAWAVTFAAVGGSIGAASVALLIVYPVVDVAAAVVDVRISRDTALFATVVISTLAAAGLAVAAASGIPAVLRVWGAWAILAGLVQLLVALHRRSMGGQWPMILAGGISLFAGSGFVVQAAHASSMTMIAGYAALGGLFFLASSIRLRRQLRSGSRSA